jgi:hypothetical protein
MLFLAVILIRYYANKCGSSSSNGLKEVLSKESLPVKFYNRLIFPTATWLLIPLIMIAINADKLTTEYSIPSRLSTLMLSISIIYAAFAYFYEWKTMLIGSNRRELEGFGDCPASYIPSCLTYYLLMALCFALYFKNVT